MPFLSLFSAFHLHKSRSSSVYAAFFFVVINSALLDLLTEIKRGLSFLHSAIVSIVSLAKCHCTKPPIFSLIYDTFL